MDRIDEAKSVIRSVNPEADVEKVINEIAQSIDKEVFAHSIVLFKKPYLRLVLIGIIVGCSTSSQASMQLCTMRRLFLNRLDLQMIPL